MWYNVTYELMFFVLFFFCLFVVFFLCGRRCKFTLKKETTFSILEMCLHVKDARIAHTVLNLWKTVSLHSRPRQVNVTFTNMYPGQIISGHYEAQLSLHHPLTITITGSANHPFLALLETELRKGAAHDIGLKA